MGSFQEVVEVARAGMEELNVPGIALGILWEGEEETAGLGVTSLDNPLEVTTETLFQIGSITKTYTATAILRLVEQEKLDLDDPVRKYVPELRLADEDVASRVSVRQLLTHTGGWLGDYFDPLGLEQSFFFADEVITRRFAVGHSLNEEQETVVARPWAIGRAAHPAGGIVGSVRDLLRYARFWIEGGDLLEPESVAEMLRPQVPIGGDIDADGLAWMLRTLDGVKLIGHGGGTKGQVSWLAIAPEQGFALVVLTNHEYGGVVGQRVVDKAYETYLGVREPELEPIELDPADYLGRYESRMGDIELVQTDDGLELRMEPKGGFPTPDTPPEPAPPPAPVAFASADEIFVPEGMFKGGRGVFLRDAEGRIAWLRVGGRVHSPVRTK